MIEPDDRFITIPVELNLGRDDLASGQIVLTEGGNLTIQFEEGIVSPSTRPYESWNTIEGTDDRGFDLRVDNTVVSKEQNFSLTELSPQSVCISQNENFAPRRDEQVVIDFDVLCFLPQIPPRNQIDSDTRKAIEILSKQRDTSIDIPEEFEIPYISTDDYEVYGVPLVDTTDRRDLIKSHENSVRTAKIRIKQQIHGDLAHQVEEAEDIILRILELSQLVQETTPRHVRAKVVSVNDAPIEDVDAYYEILKSGETANVGASFSQFPDSVLWVNFDEYIECAYNNYTSHVRDHLRLRQVLGYYIDARVSGRPVEGRMLSVCSAIELFALWHAREDGVSEKTAPRITHLIDKFCVETDDLAEQVLADPSELEWPEYFWWRERNYVSHGAPNVSTKDLINAFEAVLLLLKRIIRNQLLGIENDSFEKFYSMNPRPRIEFD